MVRHFVIRHIVDDNHGAAGLQGAHEIADGMRGVGTVNEALDRDDQAVAARLALVVRLVCKGHSFREPALARAKVLQPKLLLLDEPTSNLDGIAREQVIALIPSLTQAGSSVVMACHDRDLISLPGVQRLKLRDGRLQTRQNQVRAVK